jgi:hypothetical protein
MKIPFIQDQVTPGSFMECRIMGCNRYRFRLGPPSEFVEFTGEGFPQQDQVDDDQPAFDIC